jgi:hypothetical protein
MRTLHAPKPTTSRPADPGRRRNPHGAQRLAPTLDPGHTGQPSAAMSASARTFLARFARTLALLVLSMAAVVLGWSLASGTDWASSHPWLTATAATTGWGLAVAVWLRRRGWRRGTVHLVTWAAPAIGLLPLVWLGWLTPDGLVLWGPASTLFAVAFAMAADPMGDDGGLGGQMRVALDDDEYAFAGTPDMHGVLPTAARSRSRPPLVPAGVSTRPAGAPARVLNSANDPSSRAWADGHRGAQLAGSGHTRSPGPAGAGDHVPAGGQNERGGPAGLDSAPGMRS